jgi:hypothetical protein
VTANEENAIWMSDSELEQGKDIEEKIVADLVKKHSEFIMARNNSLPGNYCPLICSIGNILLI